MNVWKPIFCSAVLIAGAALFAENYTSDGFSAEISKIGMLMNLKYKGQLLCNQVQINGSYHLPKDAKKYDTRFFQGWDYTGQAVCGARGCTRACMMSLEARGVLQNTFKEKFRRRPAWTVDWSTEPEYSEGTLFKNSQKNSDTD